MRWIRTYYDEDDTWSYFELDEEEWALRQVDHQGLGRRPVTAAALAEVVHVRDHADVAAVSAYERKFGVLAEGSLQGWEQADGAAEITLGVFEQIWTAARAHLESLDATGTERAR